MRSGGSVAPFASSSKRSSGCEVLAPDQVNLLNAIPRNFQVGVDALEALERTQRGIANVVVLVAKKLAVLRILGEGVEEGCNEIGGSMLPK
jgi:hypothetical protein